MRCSDDDFRSRASRCLAFATSGLALALVFTAAEPAEANCNFIAGAENSFRASRSTLDRPFGAPGFPVTVQLDLTGCEASAGAGFVDQDASGAADDDFDVLLLFTPPNGPTSAVVVRDADDPSACTGFAGSGLQTTCESELPVLGDGDPNLPTQAACILSPIDVIDAATLQFTFPDTQALVGSSAPAGSTLAGPGKVVVVPRSETNLPCELAQAGQLCSGTAPASVVACADEFYERNDTCSTEPANRLSAFPGFTALPRWNDYEAMCVAADGSPCDGLQPVARFTVDPAGNLAIPINWGGVLVRLEDETPVPRLVNLTTPLPAFAGAAAPIRIPGLSFAAALSPEGHFLPPIFSPIADQTGAGNPVLFGSVDAEFSVTRINRRGSEFEWCVGGDFDGDPCNQDSECTGGGVCQPSVCHAPPNPGERPVPVAGNVACTSDVQCAAGQECGPSLFDFTTRFAGEGCGPAVDSSYTAVSGSLVPLEALFTQGSDEILALPRVEAIEASEGSPALADFNQDGDLDDISITLVNRTTGIEQQIGIEALGAPGVATSQVFEGPYRFTAMDVEDDILAFLQSEVDDFHADHNSNGRIQDAMIRIYRLGADDALPNPPINSSTATSADAGPVINGLALQVSDGLVFYRVSEADEGQRDTRPASTDENDTPPNSFDSGFAGNFADSSRERGAMSSDGRFIVFDTTADSIDGDYPDSEEPGDSNSRRDVYLRDRDPDEDGIFDEYASIDIELISIKTDGSQGTADSGPSFVAGADVSDDGRFVVFPSRANLDEEYDDDFVTDMYLRDRTAGTTIQISTGDCKADGGSDPEAAVISNDGSTVAFGIVPQEEGDYSLCVHDVASGVTQRVMNDAYAPSLSRDGQLLAFVSLEDLARKDDDGGIRDAYVLDRRTGEVEWVSPITPAESVLTTTMSDDGRYVAFTTRGNHDPDDSSNPDGYDNDPYVYDRATGDLRFIDLTSVLGTDFIDAFEPSDLAASGSRIRLSPDGRYLASITQFQYVYPEDTFEAYSVVTDLATDVTRWGSFDNASGSAFPVSESATDFPGISERGLFTGFATEVAAVYRDQNGEPDAYASGIVTSPAPLYGPEEGDFLYDEDLNDIVLMAVDTRSPGVDRYQLGPASQVSVVGGNAAFLCDEDAWRFGADGNFDEDSNDTNVCYWQNRAEGTQNLGQDAREIASSLTQVAARVWNGVPTATTVAVYDVGAETWTPVVNGSSQTADSICGVTGDTVVFTTREWEQGLDFNADGDQADRYAQAWDAQSNALFDVAVGAEFCEVGPLAGICVGAAGAACAADADCTNGGFCDAGACRAFGGICQTTAECGVGETCLEGSIFGVATSEAGQCHEDLLCQNAESFGCLCDSNEDGDCCDEGERAGLAQCDTMAFCQALPTTLGCSDCDLNGDGDCCDDVLQAYDTATERLVNCGQAVTPCVLEACDPRDSFRVEENQIRFLTEECDQATGDLISSVECSMDATPGEGGDLNRNGVTGELIVQICNARTGAITVVGAIDQTKGSTGDPLAGGGGGTAFEGRGVCILRSTNACSNPASSASSSDDCPVDQFCDFFEPADPVCAQTFGSCNVDADCPVPSTCRNDPILQASGDMDKDSVSDAFDNCVNTPNTAQADLDRDRIGDACDLTTCGNGVRENAELCDDGNRQDGDGCSSTCTVRLCDANADGAVDAFDVRLIADARGQSAAPGDPRDYDGNGVISIFDSRNCTAECDNDVCRPNTCGLVGLELLLVAIPAMRRRLRRARA